MATKRNFKHFNLLCLSAATFVCAGALPVFAQQEDTRTQNFNAVPAVADDYAPVQALDDSGAAGRLPAAAATRQVQPSFAMDSDNPQAAQVSDQIIPAQTGAAGNGEVDADPANVPAQPQNRQLVPATAMGVGADGADAQAQTQSQSQAQQGLPSGYGDGSASVPSSILDRYGATDRAMAGGDDALPSVNAATMQSLNGEFDGIGEAGVPYTPQEDPEALKEGIRRDAFDAALTGMFPLRPEEIQELLGKYDATQRAVNTPPHTAPRPEISVTNISLDPGVLPPTLKTAVGNVTTLNILDATGAPWPVQDVTWAGDFEIVEPEQGGHIIRITPMSKFARGNIVIRLLTLKTPMTMTLETSRDVVQYRVDARIPEFGPFANTPLMQGGKSMVAGDNNLMSLLDGVATGGMSRLSVAGVDGRTTAYAMGGDTYVRTPLTLLSPAWKSSVSSADGMNVYVLPSAPVLLLSDEGEFLRATLSEKEELLDE